jgi:hypothetical protein
VRARVWPRAAPGERPGHVSHRGHGATSTDETAQERHKAAARLRQPRGSTSGSGNRCAQHAAPTMAPLIPRCGRRASGWVLSGSCGRDGGGGGRRAAPRDRSAVRHARPRVAQRTGRSTRARFPPPTLDRLRPARLRRCPVRPPPPGVCPVHAPRRTTAPSGPSRADPLAAEAGASPPYAPATPSDAGGRCSAAGSGRARPWPRLRFAVPGSAPTSHAPLAPCGRAAPLCRAREPWCGGHRGRGAQASAPQYPESPSPGETRACAAPDPERPTGRSDGPPTGAALVRLGGHGVAQTLQRPVRRRPLGAVVLLGRPPTAIIAPAQHPEGGGPLRASLQTGAALHKKSGQNSDSAVNKDFLVSF